MTRYFEFNNHEYYALVAVSVEEDVIEKAAEIYLAYIEYTSNIDDVLEEGIPEEITKEEAFWKMAHCSGYLYSLTVEQFVEQFDTLQNVAIILDSALM